MDQEGRKAKYIPEIILKNPKAFAMLALLVDDELFRRFMLRLTAGQAGYIFLRADDVAVPGSQFSRLLNLFYDQRVPLCLAVVPAWLTHVRWQKIREVQQDAAHLWCWHQHGWRHINHQITGKKQEFGPHRSQFEIENDVIRGRQRLEDILEK